METQQIIQIETKHLWKKEIRVVPLDTPTITKPMFENDKFWYLCPVYKYDAEMRQGEVWVSGLLCDAIHNFTLRYEIGDGIFGNRYCDPEFKEIRNPSGKEYGYLKYNGVEHPAYLEDPEKNTRTLYPLLTRTFKNQNKKIIGVLANPEEWKVFRDGRGDPLVEILME